MLRVYLPATAMRRALGPILTSLFLALALPLAAGVAARDPRPHGVVSPVALQVAAGYGEQYRRSAWVPVRVSVRNRTNALQQGIIAIPDRGNNSQWATTSYSALYQTPVVVPPLVTKQVTLYLPGRDVGNGIDVQYRVARKVLTTASDSPTAFADQVITVGALSDDPQLMSWLQRIRPPGTSVNVVRLSPSQVDPVPEALASFDAIAVTNVKSSRLDSGQLTALERYVRSGGSLLLVGGPDWQETLRPLAPTLIPGILAGSRAVSNLSGLRTLANGSPRSTPTVVSLLSYPRGSVLASESGIPLVVRSGLGQGRIIYLAFDPAGDSLSNWSGASSLLGGVLTQAAPHIVSRPVMSGWQSGFFRDRFGPNTIRQELANVPSPPRPAVLLLILLTVLSVLLIGPVNFLVLRHLQKQELAWLTMPGLALLCFGSTLGVALHLKADVVLLNTIGVVQLDGDSGSQPATLYVGLITSARGDYRMVWNGQALPQSLPRYSLDAGSSPGAAPIGLQLQEGAQTAVDFLSMDMWSARTVAMKTSVSIPGAVRADLRLAPDGSIVGVVRNDTNLTLIRPLILAGSAFLQLSDLPPRATESVHIVPRIDGQRQDSSLLWDQIYGPSPTSGDFGSWDGDPWEEPAPTPEKSLIDRLRNTAERLPEAPDVTSTSEVLFAGWSKDHLGTLTVDGATPQRRDLNLVVSPLTVHFPHGTFRLRPGTLGAYLIDDRPQSPSNGCCESRLGDQSVAIGSGGSATFEFDIPGASHIHFQQLRLSVNVQSIDSGSVGRVYDWRARRWIHVNLDSGSASLSQPDRFISPSGALLVRLNATDQSVDLIIGNPRHDLQLSGWASAP